MVQVGPSWLVVWLETASRLHGGLGLDPAGCQADGRRIWLLAVRNANLLQAGAVGVLLTSGRVVRLVPGSLQAGRTAGTDAFAHLEAVADTVNLELGNQE